MIYFNIPWDNNKNIGQAYNRFMEMLPNDDDYACFIDGDAMFLHPFFGKQLEDIVLKHPDIDCFTCLTNRVGCTWQLGGAIGSDDIKDHREFANLVYGLHYDEIVPIKEGCTPMSGVLILLKKSSWKDIGGFKNGMLGVDNQLHIDLQDHNKNIALMSGVYIYHWYRGGDRSNKKHLEGGEVVKPKGRTSDEIRILTERYYKKQQRKETDALAVNGDDYKIPNQNVPTFNKPDKPLKKIIYTAITGNYDQPLLHKVPEGWEFKMFTNVPNIPFSTYVTSYHLSNVKLARHIKICPWEYFDFDVCVWIDGNTTFDPSKIDELANYEFVISKHSERDCTYEEGQAILNFQKETPEMVNRILMRYRTEGLPEHAGMVASHAIVRWNTEKVKNFCYKWWNEVLLGTHRDQMSFNYLLWKYPIDVFFIKFRTIFQTTSIHRNKIN